LFACAGGRSYPAPIVQSLARGVTRSTFHAYDCAVRAQVLPGTRDPFRLRAFAHRMRGACAQQRQSGRLGSRAWPSLEIL